jgi:hypothetical protein
MTVSRKILIAAMTAMALAAAVVAASDALARGGHLGHAGGPIGKHSLGHHHGYHHHLRHHRHRLRRHFFTRFTPCVVWTRQGWTNVCARPR